MYWLYLIIASIIIFAIYQVVKNSLTKRFALKDTDLGTSLAEFRESHAVSSVIASGALNLQESIVQRFERMCITDPVSYKGDPSIPQLIADYKAVILGKVIDPEGLNVPSENLLGVHNPDYDRYLLNQAKALKNASLMVPSKALREERSRSVKEVSDQDTRNEFFAHFVEKGIPPMIISAALTDTKINTYTASDWNTFCKVIKEYLVDSDRFAIMNFVRLFDEKEIIFSSNKFENFVVFYNHKVPESILVEIIRERITIDQALRIIEAVELCDYTWEEGMVEILNTDLLQVEEDGLRKKYGWRG